MWSEVSQNMDQNDKNKSDLSNVVEFPVKFVLGDTSAFILLLMVTSQLFYYLLEVNINTCIVDL